MKRKLFALGFMASALFLTFCSKDDIQDFTTDPTPNEELVSCQVEIEPMQDAKTRAVVDETGVFQWDSKDTFSIDAYVWWYDTTTPEDLVQKKSRFCEAYQFTTNSIDVQSNKFSCTFDQKHMQAVYSRHACYFIKWSNQAEALNFNSNYPMAMVNQSLVLAAEGFPPIIDAGDSYPTQRQDFFTTPIYFKQLLTMFKITIENPTPHPYTISSFVFDPNKEIRAQNIETMQTNTRISEAEAPRWKIHPIKLSGTKYKRMVVNFDNYQIGAGKSVDVYFLTLPFEMNNEPCKMEVHGQITISGAKKAHNYVQNANLTAKFAQGKMNTARVKIANFKEGDTDRTSELYKRLTLEEMKSILKIYDVNKDGLITQSELDAIPSLTIRPFPEKNMGILKILDLLPNLKSLIIDEFVNGDIDISHNTNLEYFELSNRNDQRMNSRVILSDTENYPNLAEFIIRSNNFPSTLDLKPLTGVKKIVLLNSNVSEIDLSNCLLLETLDNGSTGLTKIGAINWGTELKPYLTNLLLYKTGITSIDLNLMPNLKNLNLESCNELTSIDLNPLVHANEVKVSGSKITDYYVQHCMKDGVPTIDVLRIATDNRIHVWKGYVKPANWNIVGYYDKPQYIEAE